MNVLREYHAALGDLIFRYEGTLDRYAGDGVMILFNAPIQFPDHTKRAVKMAVEMRDTIGLLTQKWRNRGHSLGFELLRLRQVLVRRAVPVVGKRHPLTRRPLAGARAALKRVPVSVEPILWQPA